ncbi:helix-turn-helix domain-containing protein [Asaia lannensis]|uniref:Helix-turn-helix domain-containing protein n=1 Tax=Asaia lannensis NBRC 102526 TaxID=1307926 RepID=A0ABT1CDB7_9PROT|nr:helix-turn-helix transcriptional regulator [Asaia lannensis]MCO6158566.1 helix-turn-helix domain-containing protein [Asaia lannensis NBRC 102526]GBR00829.1 transcriptional regulator [Asaia lannensis NBRC 102526]
MSNTVKSASAAGPVDALVGARIRLRRTLLGMSQEKLGAALGLTFQQVQKYERGANKVGASRLYEMSKVLDVPIGFFFDDLVSDGRDGRGLGMASPGFSEAPSGFGEGKETGSGFGKARTHAYPPLDEMSVELLRAFRNISDVRVRRQLVNLVKSMATTVDTSD